MKVKPKVLKCIRLDENTIKAVDALSKQENRNFSNMVETMLKRELDRFPIFIGTTHGAT